MKVDLIHFTGKGSPNERWAAAELLIFTKQTRLSMTPGLLEEIAAWSDAAKLHELEYMAGTIPSSWEMVDLTFLLEGVSRACAQQITRTRNASYAMQSQRVVDAGEFEYVFTDGNLADDRARLVINDVNSVIRRGYQALRELGQAPQDARGVLPMNITCNLVAKYNLRSLVDVVKARKSLRAQGEYAAIADEMQRCVLEVWPWAAPFFRSNNEAAIQQLEGVAKELGITTGSGPGWQIAKAIDLLRKA